MTLRYIFCCVALLISSWAHAVQAGPSLLFSPDNDAVLYAEDIDRPWHPASVTKIMTAYVAFEAIKAGRFSLDSKIPYSELASKMPASKIGMRVGSEVSVEFALKALIIKSANDIAVALAEAVGGSHDGFVAIMNATAERLGMTRTIYVNPNGLPAPGQYTTARDLALLSKAVIRDHPEYAEYWTKSSMRVGRSRLRSHNSLLRTFDGADGIKTGFICDAGYNIVASATRNGLQLIAIVLGEQTPDEREKRAGSLLEHGFQTYDWQVYFGAPKLSSIPLSNEYRKAVSIRRTIPMRVCGGRRPRRNNKIVVRKSAASASEETPQKEAEVPKNAPKEVNAPQELNVPANQSVFTQAFGSDYE